MATEQNKQTRELDKKTSKMKQSNVSSVTPENNSKTHWELKTLKDKNLH